MLKLGGAGAGILLNLLPVVRLRFEEGTIVNTIVLKNHTLNWPVLILTAGLLGVIFLYLLAVNFQVFAPLVG